MKSARSVAETRNTDSSPLWRLQTDCQSTAYGDHSRGVRRGHNSGRVAGQLYGRSLRLAASWGGKAVPLHKTISTAEILQVKAFQRQPKSDNNTGNHLRILFYPIYI